MVGTSVFNTKWKGRSSFHRYLCVSCHTFSELSLVRGVFSSEFNESSTSRKKTHNLKGIIKPEHQTLNIFQLYVHQPGWFFSRDPNLILLGPWRPCTVSNLPKKKKNLSLGVSSPVGRLDIFDWRFSYQIPTKPTTPHQHQWSETWFPPYKVGSVPYI